MAPPCGSPVMVLDFLLMDERSGRSAAQRLGLRCVGQVGFLIEAKRRGLITDAVGTAELAREKAGFWVSQELRKRYFKPLWQAE
jgi:predicted nucleic acid-binding protein